MAYNPKHRMPIQSAMPLTCRGLHRIVVGGSQKGARRRLKASESKAEFTDGCDVNRDSAVTVEWDHHGES